MMILQMIIKDRKWRKMRIKLGLDHFNLYFILPYNLYIFSGTSIFIMKGRCFMMNLVVASIFCQDLGPFPFQGHFPFSRPRDPHCLSFLERHPSYWDSTWRSTQRAGTNSRCLFKWDVYFIQELVSFKRQLTVPTFKMNVRQSIQ